MEKDGEFSFPSEFPYEFDFGSSTTESEAEEEDRVAIIRQLSRTTFSTQHNKAGFSGSPKSTLCGVEGFNPVPRKGSPNNFQSYQQISPPTTPFALLDRPQQVADRGLLGPYIAYSSANYGVISADGLGGGGGGGELNFQGGGWFLEDTCVWPPIRVQPQQQFSQFSLSNANAGFHGGCVRKRDCAGTGVFLPRRYENNDFAEYPKKIKACPASLRPVRPIQDIKKGFPPPSRSPAPNAPHGHFGDCYDVLMARRNEILAARHLQLMKTELAMKQQELFLPQEWTH